MGINLMLGRAASYLPRRLRRPVRFLVYAPLCLAARCYWRMRLWVTTGNRSDLYASRCRLALFSLSCAKVRLSGGLARQQWQARVDRLAQTVPYRRPLPWLTVAEAHLLPQLDCKGRAVLLAHRALQLGLAPKLCIGYKPRSDTAHAWVEIEDGNECWAADGIGAGIGQARTYRQDHRLEEITCIPLPALDAPQALEKAQ